MWGVSFIALSTWGFVYFLYLYVSFCMEKFSSMILRISALCYWSGIFLPNLCLKLQGFGFSIVSQFLHIPFLWFKFFHSLCFFGLVPIFYIQALIFFSSIWFILLVRLSLEFFSWVIVFFSSIFILAWFFFNVAIRMFDSDFKS